MRFFRQLKTNRGQNTIEYLTLFAAVISFLIMFLVSGFPYLQKKRFGPGYVIKWTISPFQRVFKGLLKEPGTLVNDQIREISRLDVYAPWSPSMPPITLRENQPCRTNCAGINATQCSCNAPCYTGTNFTGQQLNASCTTVSGKCVCDKSQTSDCIIPCFTDTSQQIQLGSELSGSDFIPIIPTCAPQSPDTCYTHPEEPGTPAYGIDMHCYPGKQYNCHEVWCIGAFRPPSTYGVKVVEYDKVCDTRYLNALETCPPGNLQSGGGDLINAYECKPGDNFTCVDLLTLPWNYNGIPNLGGNYGDNILTPSVGWQIKQRTVKCTPILGP